MPLVRNSNKFRVESGISMNETVKERLKRERKKATYDALSERYGVNKYYLWNIVNTEGFEPDQDDIRKRLGYPEIIRQEVTRDPKTGRFAEKGE